MALLFDVFLKTHASTLLVRVGARDCVFLLAKVVDDFLVNLAWGFVLLGNWLHWLEAIPVFTLRLGVP